MSHCLDEVWPSRWLLVLLITSAHAGDAVTALYLEVSVNGQPTQRIAPFSQQGTQLWIARSDLAELGIDAARIPGPVDPATPIDLATVAGLTFQLDTAHQSIDLRAVNALLVAHVIGARQAPAVAGPSDVGLILNYDAFAQSVVQSSVLDDTQASLAIESEQRFFSPVGVFDNTGLAAVAGPDKRYVRQDTSWRYDWPASITTLQVGDSVSSALSWTRSVRFAGLQIRSDFSLQPNLITFPIPQLAGSAALPSTVDLYVNNIRQSSTQIPAGPFIANNFPSITGAGLATLVVRNSLGQAVSTTLPMYIDNRLLAEGLRSYSIEGGGLRYEYGSQSFDYRGPAVASGSVRYGTTNWLTLEGHAEATDQLVVAGAGALLRLGDSGVVNAALAQSAGPVSYGEQSVVGYQLITQRISIALQDTRATSHYRDLAAVGGSPPPRLLDQITLGFNAAYGQTAGGSLVRVTDTAVAHSAIGALWYSARLTRRLSVLLNASQDFSAQHSRALWAGFSIDLGDRVGLYSSFGVQDGRPMFQAAINRSADYSGGWEGSAQLNREDGMSNAMFRGGYLSDYGEVTAGLQDAEGRIDATGEAIGGFVFMDGVVSATRRVGTGFALVSTDGEPGVPVLHENRVIGVTDGSGHLLVPDLNAYEHNNLAIDSLTLPADAHIDVDRIDVTPREGAGVLARFSISTYHAATAIVVDTSGKVLPAGTALHRRNPDADYVVGYDGIAFIEDLQPQNRLEAHGAGIDCAVLFDFTAVAADKGQLPGLGPLVCRPSVGATP